MVQNEVKMETWDPLKIELKCVTVVIFTLWRVPGQGPFLDRLLEGFWGAFLRATVPKSVPGGSPEGPQK